MFISKIGQDGKECGEYFSGTNQQQIPIQIEFHAKNEWPWNTPEEGKEEKSLEKKEEISSIEENRVMTN